MEPSTSQKLGTNASMQSASTALTRSAIKERLEASPKNPSVLSPEDLQKYKDDMAVQQKKGERGWIKNLVGNLLLFGGAATVGVGTLLAMGGSTLAIVSIPFIGAYGAGVAGVAVGAFVTGLGIALMMTGVLMGIGGTVLSLKGTDELAEAVGETMKLKKALDAKEKLKLKEALAHVQCAALPTCESNTSSQ